MRPLYLLLFLVILAPTVFAENQTGVDNVAYQKALSFYSSNTSGLEISEKSFVMYDVDSYQLFYSLENLQNESKVVLMQLGCVSKKCPTAIYVDTMPFDELPGRVKKAAGLFVVTNNTPLGVYEYELNVTDNLTKEMQSVRFEFEVISPHFWRQFVHNLLSLFS
ncbi:MAG TPA: hypothetical protein VK158_04895 [Acidobacteriota bacterium]|nr:hypothetical protein [Acidobacteriota bacterium]